jgi:hypothetical protein
LREKLLRVVKFGAKGLVKFGRNKPLSKAVVQVLESGMRLLGVEMPGRT